MCRRFTIIKNIERLTIEDIVKYLKRVIKIYVIFACLAIYNAVTAVTNSGRLLIVIKVVDAILYCIYTGSLVFFTQYPTLLNLHFPLIAGSILDLFYVLSLLLQIADTDYRGGSAKANIAISVFTSLISILLLSSMVYIFLKLRTKMILRNAGMDDPQEPIMVVAMPVQPTAPMKMDSNV